MKNGGRVSCFGQLGRVIGVYLAGLVATISVSAQQPLELDKECIDRSRPGVETVKSTCDHGRMLKEGNNIHAVNMTYQAKKVELLREDQKKGNIRFDSYVKDGTCLTSDNNDIDKCIARLERARLDARVETREAVLKGNKARTEMESKDPAAEILRRFGTDSAKAPEGTILRDINKAASQPRPDPRTLLAAPQEVNFGSSIKGQQSLEKAAEDKDSNLEVSAVGPDGELTKNKSLNSLLKTKSKQLDAAITEDQRAIKKDVDVFFSPKNPVAAAPSGSRGISRQAFEDTIQLLKDEDARQFGPAKGPKSKDALESFEKKDVDVFIERTPPPSPQNKQPQSLDQEIRRELELIN